MVNDSGTPPLPRRVPGASGSPKPPATVERTPIPEDLRQRVLAAIAIELERDEAEQGLSARGQVAVGERAASAGLAGAGERAVSGKQAMASERAEAGERAAPRGLRGVRKKVAASEQKAAAGEPSTAGQPAASGERDTGQAGGTVWASVGTGSGSATLADSPTLMDGAALADSVAQADSAAQADSPTLLDGAAVADSVAQADSAALADSAGLANGPALAGAAALDGGAPPANSNVWERYVPPATTAGQRVDAAERHEDVAPSGAAGWNYGTVADPGDHAVTPRPGGGPEDETTGEAARPEEVPSPPAVPLPRRAPGANGAAPPPAHVRREYLPPSLLGRRMDDEALTEPMPRISGFRPDGHPGQGDTRPGTVPGAPSEAAASQAALSQAAQSDAARPEAGRPGTEPTESVAPLSAPAPVAPSAQTPPATSARSAAPSSAPASYGVSGPTAPSAAEPSSAEPPAAEPGSPALVPYSWPVGDGGTRPGNGHTAGTAAQRSPAQRSPAQRSPATRPPGRPAAPQSRPGRRPGGRPYRIAGLFLSVVALVAAGSVALVLSGRSATPGHRGGAVTARGAGAAVRNRAVAWVVS